MKELCALFVDTQNHWSLAKRLVLSPQLGAKLAKFDRSTVSDDRWEQFTMLVSVDEAVKPSDLLESSGELASNIAWVLVALEKLHNKEENASSAPANDAKHSDEGDDDEGDEFDDEFDDELDEEEERRRKMPPQELLEDTLAVLTTSVEPEQFDEELADFTRTKQAPNAGVATLAEALCLLFVEPSDYWRLLRDLVLDEKLLATLGAFNHLSLDAKRWQHIDKLLAAPAFSGAGLDALFTKSPLAGALALWLRSQSQMRSTTVTSPSSSSSSIVAANDVKSESKQQ
jgi:hypothetical protein